MLGIQRTSKKQESGGKGHKGKPSSRTPGRMKSAQKDLRLRSKVPHKQGVVGPTMAVKKKIPLKVCRKRQTPQKVGCEESRVEPSETAHTQENRCKNKKRDKTKKKKRNAWRKVFLWRCSEDTKPVSRPPGTNSGDVLLTGSGDRLPHLIFDFS